MLNRVFKTIFILTLCLGITLPANAGGVDVSDGSAFITKSELSYQLNALSSRMIQLENSLDSKIDRLVSSYLTRNGIWNGSTQDLTMKYYAFTPWKNASTTSTFTWTKGSNGYTGETITNGHITKKINAKTPTSYTAGVYYRQDWDTNVTIINSINKSGMLMLIIQVGFGATWSGLSGDPARCFCMPFVSAAGWRFVGLSGVHIVFNIGSGSEKDPKLDITTLNAIYDLHTPQLMCYGINNSDETYCFFVDKGQTLSFDVYWEFMSYVANGGFQTNQEWNTWGGNQQCVGVAFKDCSVY